MARALEGQFAHVIVHTGQHYDDVMSTVFFEGLSLPHPDHNLNVGSGTHAVQTASMMTGLEKTLLEEKPDIVIVYGDTNSTLAGALVAAKLNIPVAHIEAGLRSFNRDMPEEINRIIVDRISQFLFSPSMTAMNNLAREGLKDAAHFVGDVMLDALMQHQHLIERHFDVLDRIGVQRKAFYLATVHRASNTDDAHNLVAILEALDVLDAPVVFPMHPRTRGVMTTERISITKWKNIKSVEPVGYLDMLALQLYAKKVLTDSGGVQKEAYYLGTPCVTFRKETEWPETLQSGWNILVGVDKEAIIEVARVRPPQDPPTQQFGDGNASNLIVEILLNGFS